MIRLGIALFVMMVLVACEEEKSDSGARTDEELARICTELGTAVESIEHERCMEVLRHEY